ncbi:MAG: hypothetical protein WBY53_10890 [Acidobacteriaceae bacterium]
MLPDLKDTNPNVQLPAVLAVGFTGHRNLPNEAESRKLLYDLLAEKKRSTSEVLLGISSIAAGADLLFAESCIALNIPLRVLLPFPVDDFRADFDPPSWSRAERVMKQSISIEVIGNAQQRDERYYECGVETVLQTQWLIALWNGEAAHGLGGTQQIVAFARRIGKPVVWIHSLTGAVQLCDEKQVPALDVDPELRFLNRLSSSHAVVNGSPPDIATAWLKKLDDNALQVAPQVRRLAAVPIVCTAIAAVVSGAASQMHPSSLWVAVGALLGLTAALLPAALRLGKRQALWVRIRTAAEVSRSVRALWNVPSQYQVVGPEILPELSGMVLSLNFLKSQAAPATTEGVEAFKSRYLSERLLDQKQYFLTQSTKSAEKAKRYRLISKICVIAAIGMSAWMFGARALLNPGRAISGGTWLSLAASALFQIATIAGAMVVVNDCDRRERRYREIHDSLKNWEMELRAFRTWPLVIRAANKIERALLIELLEWRSLLQNTKMPRN